MIATGDERAEVRIRSMMDTACRRLLPIPSPSSANKESSQRPIHKLAPGEPGQVLNEPQISMTQTTPKIILGADLSKDWIDVWVNGQTQRLANQPDILARFVRDYPRAAIAMEATNTYHLTLLTCALNAQLSVYLINGYQLTHYAQAVATRMRNDRIDAQLLARFLIHEIDHLRAVQAHDQRGQQLWCLLKRRALVVKQRQQLQHSLGGIGEVKTAVAALQHAFKQLLAHLDQQLARYCKDWSWCEDHRRLQTLPGVVPLTAYGLLCAYHSGQFTHRDALVVFVGLDVKSKDSGRHRGQRKLSKQGDPEYRRLLFNAAMAARKTVYVKAYYEAALQRGISTIGAINRIARKLVRLAFVLLQKQLTFDPKRFKTYCQKT